MSANISELAVRWGTPEDYPAVLDIQRRAYQLKEVPLYGPNLPPLQETPETMAKEAAEGKRLLVGVMDGRVVASLRQKTLDDGAIYFGRLSVDPDMQGRGIGQRMTKAVEDMNPEANEFALDCGVDSVENMHIYKKMGYKLTGGVVQVPNGPKCLEMRKHRV